MKLDQNFVKEVARVLNDPLPRSRRQGFSIVVPDARDEEEFRFRFYECGAIAMEYVMDGKKSFGDCEPMAGTTPQEIAEQIIAAIKEMPQRRRDFFERYEKQRQELAAAA